MIGRKTICVVLVAISVSLNGCSLSESSSDATSGVSAVQQNLPAAGPVTFSGTFSWSTDAVIGTYPVVLDEGIALVVEGRSNQKKHRVQLVDAGTGVQRWVSDDFENAGDTPPKVYVTKVSGANWLVVERLSGDKKVLDFYSAQGQGDRRVPDYSYVSESMGTKFKVLAGGVADLDTKKVVSVSAEKAWKYDGPGDFFAHWMEGDVVAKIDKAPFGFVVGGKALWTASAPDGAADASGKLLDVGNGITVSQWGSGEKAMFAVHDIRSGKVLATADGNAGSLANAESLMYSKDGDWAWYGNVVFNMRTGKGSFLEVRGGRIGLIYDGIAYIYSATSPISADGQRQKVGTATYDGMVDAGTGQALTNDNPQMVPIEISDASQGIFVEQNTDARVAEIYSVPLS